MSNLSHRNGRSQTGVQNLRVVQWNCFQFINRHDLFGRFLQQTRPDVVLLNEIKMNQELSNFYLDIQGYASINKPRNEHGGGVAVLIKNGLDYTHDHDFDIFDQELISISLKLEMGWLGVITLYNPPTETLSSDLFEAISKKYDKFILGGDLNAKSRSIGCRKDNHNANSLISILENNNLQVINDTTPTHCKFNTNEYDLLDLFICTNNLMDKISNFFVHSDDMLSDHFPIEVGLTEAFSIKVEDSEDRFNFNKANWDLFKRCLEQKDLVDGDVSSMWTQMVENIIEAASVSIPKRSNIVYKNTLPKEIVQIIKERRIARKKKKKTGRPEDRAEYNRLTAVLKLALSKNRSSEWGEFIKKMGTNPLSVRPFWKKINKFRGKKGRTRLSVLKHDGNVLFVELCQFHKKAKSGNKFNNPSNRKTIPDLGKINNKIRNPYFRNL